MHVKLSALIQKLLSDGELITDGVSWRPLFQIGRVSIIIGSLTSNFYEYM